MLVSLADGRIALVDLTDAACVQVTHRASHAGEPIDDVALDGARAVASAAGPLPALALPVWTLGAVARSAMMVGALEFVLEQSVQYANDRVQFGRPIGKNQAIQQQLALLAGDVGAARVAALVACEDAPSSAARECAASAFSAAVAKVRCGESATRATSIAHQVHGAIGFTYEHQLQFATRRLWAWRESFGSDGWWAQRLGEAAIRGRSAAFWPSMTQRRFDGLDAALR
jgi:acyl-CoA dehydrogenase